MKSLIFSSKPCRALTLLSSLIFLIILSACGDSPRATLAHPDDAQAFLAQALAVTFSQNSYRFQYEFKTISTGDNTTSTGSGTFQGPDRLQGTGATEFSAGDRNVKLETATIFIGADLYTKHDGEGDWTVETVEETTALTQMKLLDLDPYRLNGLRFIDDEFIDGAHVFHLISESPPGVGIADMDPRLSQRIEYWVESDTLRIVRYVLAGSDASGAGLEVSHEFSDYGESFEIFPPIISTTGPVSP